jgi:hypothetical protein
VSNALNVLSESSKASVSLIAFETGFLTSSSLHRFYPGVGKSSNPGGGFKAQYSYRFILRVRVNWNDFNRDEKNPQPHHEGSCPHVSLTCSRLAMMSVSCGTQGVRAVQEAFEQNFETRRFQAIGQTVGTLRVGMKPGAFKLSVNAGGHN